MSLFTYSSAPDCEPFEKCTKQERIKPKSQTGGGGARLAQQRDLWRFLQLVNGLARSISRLE